MNSSLAGESSAFTSSAFTSPREKRRIDGGHWQRRAGRAQAK